MSRYKLVVGLAALALAAGPAFAQTTPAAKPPAPAPAPMQSPHHAHPARVAARGKVVAASGNADMSADALNAKELSTLQTAGAAPMTPMPAPAKKP
jgi:hypothetical protein